MTAQLFDPVPTGQMKEAAQAVQAAASTIPAEVGARFETAAKLNDEDGKTIIEIARKSLARFLPKPEPKPEAKPTEPSSNSKNKDDTRPTAQAGSELKPVANPNGSKPVPKPEVPLQDKS